VKRSGTARRRRRWLALGLLLLLGLAGGAGGLVLAPPSVLPGPPFVEIASPEPEERRSNESLEVFLQFPEPERVRPETLRVRINGADVTSSFVTASNGAYGDVVLLVDGENVLEASIFGRSWWSGDRLVERTVRRRFRVRRPIERHWG